MELDDKLMGKLEFTSEQLSVLRLHAASEFKRTQADFKKGLVLFGELAHRLIVAGQASMQSAANVDAFLAAFDEEGKVLSLKASLVSRLIVKPSSFEALSILCDCVEEAMDKPEPARDDCECIRCVARREAEKEKAETAGPAQQVWG